MPNGLTREEERELFRLNTKRFGEPVGHYTGRCGLCGSKDLWDDQTAYGCNSCKAMWFFG